MKAIQLLWTGLALALFLSACKKEKEPVPAVKLVAVAGPDQTVAVSAPVQLDGTASRGGNGRDFTSGTVLLFWVKNKKKPTPGLLPGRK